MVVNTTGLQPGSNLLSVPRACWYVALLNNNDEAVTGYEDLGVVDSAVVTFETDESDKYSSCGEQRVRIARITTEISASLTVECSSLLLTRLQQYLLSSKPRLGVDAKAPQDGTRTGVIYLPNPKYTGAGALSPDQQDAKGKYYKVWTEGTSGGDPRVFAGWNPEAIAVAVDASGTAEASPRKYLPNKGIFGLDIENLEIYLPDAGDDPLVGQASDLVDPLLLVTHGDGMTVNAKQGTIFVPTTGKLATAIDAAGTANLTDKYLAFHLKYNPDANNVTVNDNYTQHQALAAGVVSVAMRFEQQDIARPGYRAVTEVYKVRIAPSGDYALVGDGTDFESMTLEGSVELPAWRDGTAGLEGFFDKFDDIVLT